MEIGGGREEKGERRRNRMGKGEGKERSKL
jgi:hypothetical protein